MRAKTPSTFFQRTLPWRRPAPVDGLLAEIRGHDLSGCSDAELREQLTTLRGSATDADAKGLLPSVFALVDEAIGRRLGAWRLFDPEQEAGSLAKYREMAGRVLEVGPYRSQVGYYTDEGFIDSAAFRRSIGPMLSEMALDGDGRAIVEAMAYVAEKRRSAYTSDVLLPAKFYDALAAKDAEGALSLRVTDEQVRAGLLLYRGAIVEMSAGEGKTFAAAFPAVLHAVLGRRVHVITANDYLASRDGEWLAPVYESLGLEVRAVLGHMGDGERRYAYQGDIVYGTLREFGFDFLRDNLRYSADDLVQGPLEVAIVDEADQALIDEARTPLIIAGPPTADGRSVHKAKNVVELMIARQQEVVPDLVEQARRSASRLVKNGECRGAKPLCRESEGAPQIQILSPLPGRKGVRGMVERVFQHSANSLQEQVDVLARLYLAGPENGYLAGQLSLEDRLRRRVLTAAHSALADVGQSPLARSLYYAVDPPHDVIVLTDTGQEFLERHLGPTFDTGTLELELEHTESRDDIPLAQRRLEGDRLRRRLSSRYSQMNQVQQTLRACLLLKRDVDYVVTGGEVVLVDKLTGRVRPDSKYQYGLQAALEAKEGVHVHPATQALARVSVQGFMKQYSLLSGMTGTATASADEFRRVYGLDVVALPPALPSRRTDLPTRLYASRHDKLQAVVDQVKLCRRVGRPVLVGALTVEQSQEISRLLTQHRIQHRLLNAGASAGEEDVVKGAGRLGAVTVATNMAGRGTDIVLEPGLDERITEGYVKLVHELLSGGASEVTIACATGKETDVLESALARLGQISVARRRRAGDGQTVVAASGRDTPGSRHVELEFGLGLHVIGTEMNGSKRVDAQLRGRAGRQGEPGTSRLMMSLEDPSVVFGAGSRPPAPQESKSDPLGRTFSEGVGTARRIGTAQAAVELEDEASRGSASEYDRAVELQAFSYYRARSGVARSGSFHAVCLELMRDRARRLVDGYLPAALIGRYGPQFDRMADELRLDYRLDVEHLWGLGIEALKQELASLMAARLEQARTQLGDRQFDEAEKMLFLRTGDELWAGHLSRLYDMMLSTSLCARDHRCAVADYVFRSREAYQRLREEVTDAFLPGLLAFAFDNTPSTGAQHIEVAKDVQEILV